jgi:aspartate/methionine/tyrosine aminotransferase
MTGFRLGYVIAPPAAVRALQNMQQNFHISAAHFVQTAGIAALEHGAAFVADMRSAYERRRDLLWRGLCDLGFGVARAPEGAFYVLADARFLGADSLALALDLLERNLVTAAPGRDFGDIAEGYLRFSFATGEDQIAQGLRRLAQYVQFPAR